MNRFLFPTLAIFFAAGLSVGDEKKEKVFQREVVLDSHSAVTAEPREPNSPISLFFKLSWWGPRHESIVERVKKGGVDLIMAGDSITHHWESVGKETWEKYYADCNAVNMGFSCDGTQNLLWRLYDDEISGISPKAAVVLIGTNNSGANTAEQIADGIAAILQKMRKDLPKTKILLLAIFPRGDQPKQQPVIDKTNEIIKNFADDEYIYFLDITKIWLAPDGQINLKLMPDKLHPNAEGYKVWAKAMQPTLQKLMGADFVESAGKKENVFERKVAIGSHLAVTPVPRPDPRYEEPGKTSGWMAIHQKTVEKAGKGNVNLIMIGDSITACFRSVGKETWDKYYLPRKVLNLGFSGDKTQHILWRLSNGELNGIEPDVAVIMAGTNNSAVNSPEEIADGIAAICQTIRTKLPKTRILLLAIFPRANKSGNMQVIDKTNEIIGSFADNQYIFFLDINKVWLKPDGTVNKDLMPDLLHPNAEGYKLWAAAMEPTVEKLLAKK